MTLSNTRPRTTKTADPSLGYSPTSRLVLGLLVIAAAAAYTRPLEHLAAHFGSGQLDAIYSIPLGVVVTIIYRNLVGLQTFGVFAPLILGLALLATGPGVGLAVLAGAVVLGLSVRDVLGNYRILTTTRSAVLVAGGSVMLAVFAFLADYVGMEGQAVIGAFPLVILVGLTERIASAIEEDGPTEAAKMMSGTAVVALTTWYLATEMLASRLNAHPDLVLFALPLTVLVGTYRGLRISELARFKGLGNHAA